MKLRPKLSLWDSLTLDTHNSKLLNIKANKEEQIRGRCNVNRRV